MTDALSAQTGLRVSCRQAGVAGIPWGLAEIFFEANDESARSVLKRLFIAAATNQPDRDYWLQRCDPLHPPDASSIWRTFPARLSPRVRSRLATIRHDANSIDVNIVDGGILRGIQVFL